MFAVLLLLIETKDNIYTMKIAVKSYLVNKTIKKNFE